MSRRNTPSLPQTSSRWTRATRWSSFAIITRLTGLKTSSTTLCSTPPTSGNLTLQEDLRRNGSHDIVSLRRWLQLPFDCDSTAVRLPFDYSLTALQLFDDLRYDRRPTWCALLHLHFCTKMDNHLHAPEGMVRLHLKFLPASVRYGLIGPKGWMHWQTDRQRVIRCFICREGRIDGVITVAWLILC